MDIVMVPGPYIVLLSNQSETPSSELLLSGLFFKLQRWHDLLVKPSFQDGPSIASSLRCATTLDLRVFCLFGDGKLLSQSHSHVSYSH